MAKQTETQTREATQTVPEHPYDPMEDLVTVTLPRATGNEPNFELVALNGKMWSIQKGATVQIPRPVYDILAESLRQEDRLHAFNEANARKVSPG